MKARCLSLTLAALSLAAQDLSRLPAWAQAAAAQAQAETAPAADAWVLLERQTYTYTGHGEYREETFRLVKILGQRGLSQGRFYLGSMGGRAETLDSLKGWNLRPDGELVRLSGKDVQVWDDDDAETVSTVTTTGAALTRLAVGSLVAFQTEKTCRLPMGPVGHCGMLEGIPVRRWECEVLVEKSWLGQAAPVTVQLEQRHLAAWGLTAQALPGHGVALANLPALPRDEHRHPPLGRILPKVEFRFLDPECASAPSFASWDAYAGWTAQSWGPLTRPSGLIATQGVAPKEALRRILAWMNRELIYKQVYLTPDRGWLPSPVAETARRRNGDCKDHAACFLGEAGAAGFTGFPVMCAIGSEVVEADQPPFPYCFNHVIAALRLKESLGLEAEVETARGRFLLVDATDRFCPLGRLPSDHRGRRVLICTDQGAVWAEVPPAATLAPALAIQLQGNLDAAGSATAKVSLLETGNAGNLRAGGLYTGVAGLQERDLRQLFDLPPTGTVSEVKMGDPLDLERPFAVTFRLSRPGGLNLEPGHGQLASWGLPGPRAAVQKLGVPRVYPLEVRQAGILDYHAVWNLPMPVTPRLPALESESPFLSLRWKAEAAPGTVTLDLHLAYKDALFEGDQREAGVAAWKKDQRLMDRLNTAGRGFNLAQPGQ